MKLKSAAERYQEYMSMLTHQQALSRELHEIPKTNFLVWQIKKHEHSKAIRSTLNAQARYLWACKYLGEDV